jgi:TctA family transporter
MRPYRNQDCAAGLMFAAFGAGFTWKAFSYPLGTAGRMGPGYLPFWLGIMLVLLGAAILVRSSFENVHERRIPAFNWSILILALGPWALSKAFQILFDRGLVSSFTFQFGPPEFFSWLVLYLACAAALAWGSLLKAIAMVVLGLLFGLVGTDVNSGVVRFAFGIEALQYGIPPASVLLGALGIGLWAKLPRSRYRRVLLSAVVVAAIGIYWRLNYDTVFICATAAFGATGYLWNRLNCVSAPLFFGLVYGPLVEENFRRSLLLSRGDFSGFALRPWSAASLALSMAICAASLFMRAPKAIFGRS